MEDRFLVTLRRAPGIGFGIAIKEIKDDDNTSIFISDVVEGGPAEGLVELNDIVFTINGIAIDNVGVPFTIQLLRKCISKADIIFRRKRRVPPRPLEHPGEREPDESDYVEMRPQPSRAHGGAEEAMRPQPSRAHGGAEEAMRPQPSRAHGGAEEAMRPQPSRAHGGAEEAMRPQPSRAHGGAEEAMRPQPSRAHGGAEEAMRPQPSRAHGGAEEAMRPQPSRAHGGAEEAMRPQPSRAHGGAEEAMRPQPSRAHGGAEEAMRPQPSRAHGGAEEAMRPQSSRAHGGAEEAMRPQPSRAHGGEEEAMEPVYDYPRKHAVDLLVSPSDASMPSAAHDGCVYRSNMKVVKFKKTDTIGLTLAGGNDVGLFISRVVTDSPAARGGLEEGDHILRVNEFDFENLIREEAVLFLMALPLWEEVTVITQKTDDVYREILRTNAADRFHIRTHFQYQKESKYCLDFDKGEVLRVVDSLFGGTLGSWLAVRLDRNNNEVERGVIPNQNRAEQLCLVKQLQSPAVPRPAGGSRVPPFWKLPSLKGNSSRNLEKIQPFKAKFPPYERIVLQEAGFLRPVVIFGPIADVAREKLTREDPDHFQRAKTEPRDAGTDQRNSGIISLHTVKQIIERGKHAVLDDVSLSAVERLNYAQWHPIVVFLSPDSRKGVERMRSRLCPESRKNSTKLYKRALELRMNQHHPFTKTIQLNRLNDGWHGALKDTIRHHQKRQVWVSEGKADGGPQDALDVRDDSLSHLSAPFSEYSMYSTSSYRDTECSSTYSTSSYRDTECSSRCSTSSYQDTDTEYETCTDQELADGVSLASVSTLTSSCTASGSVREDPTTRAYPRYLHPVPPGPTGFKMGASQRTYKKDPYSMENPIQVTPGMKLPVSYRPPPSLRDKQPCPPYRDNRDKQPCPPYRDNRDKQPCTPYRDNRDKQPCPPYRDNRDKQPCMPYRDNRDKQPCTPYRDGDNRDKQPCPPHRDNRDKQRCPPYRDNRDKQPCTPYRDNRDKQPCPPYRDNQRYAAQKPCYDERQPSYDQQASRPTSRQAVGSQSVHQQQPVDCTATREHDGPSRYSRPSQQRKDKLPPPKLHYDAGLKPPNPRSDVRPPPPNPCYDVHPPSPILGYDVRPPSPILCYDVCPPSPILGYDVRPPSPILGYDVRPPSPILCYDVRPPSPILGYDVRPPSPILRLDVRPTPPNPRYDVRPPPPILRLDVRPTPPNPRYDVCPPPPNPRYDVRPPPPILRLDVRPTPPNLHYDVCPPPPNLGYDVRPPPPILRLDVHPTPPNPRYDVRPQPPILRLDVRPTPPNLGYDVRPPPPNLGYDVRPPPPNLGYDVRPTPPNLCYDVRPPSPNPRYDVRRPPTLGGSDDKPRHSQPGSVLYGKRMSPTRAEPRGFPLNSPDFLKHSALYHPGSPTYPVKSPQRRRGEVMRVMPVLNEEVNEECEPVVTASLELELQPPPASGCVAPPPSPRDENEEDPAMKAQSVRSRVRLFEDKGSVVGDRPADEAAPAPASAAPAPAPASAAPAPAPASAAPAPAPVLTPQDQTSTDGCTELPDTPEGSDEDTQEDSDSDVQYYREQLSCYARRIYSPTKPPE